MADTEEMGTPAQDASKEAVHAVAGAAEAVEAARAAQLAEISEENKRVAKAAALETAELTKTALVESLKEVFGEGDRNDGQMVVLVRRIPILCTNVEQMHKAIESIQGNITWGVRIVIAAVFLALLKLIFIP